MTNTNLKPSSPSVSIADITTDVAAAQRARRERQVLSAEEKARRKTESTTRAIASFGVAPPGAFFRQPTVLALLGVSPATLWRWVGKHPELQPTKLSERVTAWTKSQIDSFMRSRMAAA